MQDDDDARLTKKSRIEIKINEVDDLENTDEKV